MDKHCEKCAKENVGCKEIQHLFRDVDKLKASKKFNTFLYIFITVISVGFVIVSIIVWHNMLKQSISTADLKPEELKNMADLFNSQFSNLLTVLGILLTIFGALTPIVNAIYQKQTLKDERESLRREIDVSLANLEEKEKNLEDKIESAKAEREKQIAKVRSDLAQAIDSARRNFQDKQENIETKIQAFERESTYNNGYIFLQIALSNRNEMFMYGSYVSLAMMCFSVYAETDENFSERLLFSIENLSKKILECNDNTVLNFKFIIEKLKEAQKNVRNDSIYWHKLQELIETIENLANKQSTEKTSGAAIEKVE